jgi:hypothetical protein
LAIEEHPAFRFEYGPQEPGYEIKQTRFAAAALSHDRQDFSRLNVAIDFKQQLAIQPDCNMLKHKAGKGRG